MSDRFDPYHVWLGIPPEEQPPNHYRLLGLRPFEADGDVISNALDQRLAHLRTLQAGKRAALSQKLLNEVSAAGVALLDPKRKSDYDQQLRAQQPPEAAVQKMASPPPRKATLLKARSLEADALAAAVVPLPDEGYALQPAPAPAATIAAPQPMPNVQWSSPAPMKPLSTATQPRPRGSGAGIAVAIAAACVVVLAVTAGGVAWLLRNPPAFDPGPPIASPQDPQDLPPPPIAVTPPPSSPVTPTVQSPDVTPVAPSVGSTPTIPDDDRQVWVYADNSRGGLRRIGSDRWVELGESDATWYRQIQATPEAIHLEQLGGSPTQVRLLQDRLERHNAELYGTTVFYGKWRSFEGLPPFARREPGAERPLPPPSRPTNYYGLVFDGQSQLELPVPEELRQPGRPFTIEMSVRWAERQQAGCLVHGGDLRLGLVAAAAGRPVDTVSLSGGGKAVSLSLKLPPGKFHQLAIVSDGRDSFLRVNGIADPRASLPGVAALGPGPLRIGFDAQKKEGFRGILRGLRVSSVNRYPDRTQATDLPKLLAADDQTLLAIDFQHDKDDQIRLLGSPEQGKRLGAQWSQLGYGADYHAEPIPGRADLTRTFTASIHTLEGRSWRTSSELQLQSPQGRAMLMVPYLTPPNYRYETTVARTGGDGGLAIGLVLDEQPAMLLIDAAAGSARTTGLLTTGDRVLPGRTPATDVRLLTSGNSRRLSCDVITQDGLALVQLRLDNQLVYEWHGPIASAPLPSEWQLPARVLFVGSRDATFTFNTMTLTARPTPPSGWLARMGGSTAPMAGSPPTSPSPSPPPTTSAPKKQPPDAQTLAAELEKAREIYEDELKRAIKADQKAAVARNILKVGQDTTSDATVRYVLIDLARKVFIQAGEVKEALATARALEGDFEIPPDSLAIATIEALEGATLVPEQRAALATAAIELAEELLDAEQFEPASKLALAAVASANKQRDAELKKDVLQRKNQLARVVTSSQAVQESFQTLEQSPDDAAANLAVGRFRCLVLEDWELGLANLAKGGDSPLAKAAALDQDAQDKPQAALAGAEAWLAAAKDAKSGDREERQSMERRAKSLLEQALPKLSGLDLVRAEKQLGELKDVAGGPVKRPKTGRGRGFQESPGLVGRVIARNRDAGILIHYLPDYTMSREDFDKVRAAAGLAVGEPWEIRLAGQLALAADARVQVWHAGGSASGGVHTLIVDGQTLSKVGDDLTKNETRTVNLRKGVHTIGWVLKGGDMGTAGMRLTPIDAGGSAIPGGSQPMVTREMQAAARQAPTKTEFRFGS